jgi:hypothetical protein
MPRAMAKVLKTAQGSYVVKGSVETTKVVRDPKTGRFVTVQGFGALKDSDLTIRKGVSLTKPIAEQVLSQRPEKRKAG